jgi:hypothetical protein
VPFQHGKRWIKKRFDSRKVVLSMWIKGTSRSYWQPLILRIPVMSLVWRLEGCVMRSRPFKMSRHPDRI